MQSQRVDEQGKKYPRTFERDGEKFLIVATVRHDDQCRNAVNTFSVTGTIYKALPNGTHQYLMGGCIHEEIAEHFPELAGVLKWHLCSTDGPLHYIENTAYWAGLRGWCHGKPGSPPNLDYARLSAIWPEATDAQLTDAGLEARLEARLPAVLADFQRAVESLGLVF